MEKLIFRSTKMLVNRTVHTDGINVALSFSYYSDDDDEIGL